jgi:hypothetical protein
MAAPITEPEYVGDGGIKEKRVSVEVNLKPDEEEEEDEAITDLFVSFPPIKGIEAEPNPLTVRAVLTGIVLGSLVNASNVYLGKEPSCLINNLHLFLAAKSGVLSCDMAVHLTLIP